MWMLGWLPTLLVIVATISLLSRYVRLKRDAIRPYKDLDPDQQKTIYEKLGMLDAEPMAWLPLLATATFLTVSTGVWQTHNPPVFLWVIYGVMLAGAGACIAWGRRELRRYSEKGGLAKSAIPEHVIPLLATLDAAKRVAASRTLANCGDSRWITLLKGNDADFRRLKDAPGEEPASLRSRLSELARDAIAKLERASDVSAGIAWMRGSGDSACASVLVGVLSRLKTELRNEAVFALASMKDSRAIDPLLEMVKAVNHSDFKVAIKAAEALGELGDPRAIEPLEALVRNPGELISRYMADQSTVCASASAGATIAPDRSSAAALGFGILERSGEVVVRLVTQAAQAAAQKLRQTTRIAAGRDSIWISGEEVRLVAREADFVGAVRGGGSAAMLLPLAAYWPAARRLTEQQGLGANHVLACSQCLRCFPVSCRIPLPNSNMELTLASVQEVPPNPTALPEGKCPWCGSDEGILVQDRVSGGQVLAP